MTTERQVSRKAARSPIVAAAAVTVDLSSNDYLGLRNDPRVRAAAIRAIERYGVGSGGARDVAVGMGLVHELEQRLALMDEAHTDGHVARDQKNTRLNSSHEWSSDAVLCSTERK